ncbi:Protein STRICTOSIDINE SYNTHASE-LIKE 10 [Asimina triloba]
MERMCGRPLGLRFDLRTGDLYIADAFYGLLMVGPTGGAAVPLVPQAHFANDLDIDVDAGAVYFTDSSARFERR